VTSLAVDDLRPMWTCPRCGSRYVNPNAWHSCRVVPLEALFEGKGQARELFDVLLAAVRTVGPVELDVKLSGVAFMTRVRFAGAKIRRDRIRAAFWLRRAIESPRIVRTERIPPDNLIYEVDVRDPADVDDELVGWLREAYEIGAQRHPAQARYRRKPARERRAWPAGLATGAGWPEGRIVHMSAAAPGGAPAHVKGDPSMGDKTPKRPPKPKKDKKPKSATV
jgi:hypothetical protein